ncbi:hypothetical protein GGS20DRAFT_159722 [Poronia punctata]|nr:hypothetical protein GGS20DRAFT_159722 [Poronia punctata]
MCSTVIFRYSCSCTEQVVFECPFSPENRDSGAYQDPCRPMACSRPCRRHEQMLLSSASTPTTHPRPVQPRSTESTPSRPACQELSGSENNIANPDKPGTAITVLDELCHDCWHNEKRLTNDENAPRAPIKGVEDGTRPVADNILRERPVNEFALPPP